MEIEQSQTIGIIGNGSWATALVKIISAKSNVKVIWWMRDEETSEYIQNHGHNPKYLSAVEFDRSVITTTTQIKLAFEMADIIILAVPSAFLQSALNGYQIPQNKIVVSAIKGIEPTTKKVVADYLMQVHHLPLENIALISGPCHAEEVALEKLSYLTVSCTNSEIKNKISELLEGNFIRVSQTSDIIGAEYASVMKNIYAIGAGIAHGLGYGDNFQAVYVSACIREMEFLLDKIQGDHRNVNDAAYLGDLLVTCYSQFSRNRSFGTMLGKGYSVKSAQLEMNMIAEGYYAIDLMYQIALNLGGCPPILSAIHNVVYQAQSPKAIFKNLSQIQLS